MKLGLENIRALLAALNDPHENYMKVQVAGTNGKGSVCAFLDSICVHAGIKTGLYTSPHLISITERIKIGGKDLSETDIARHSTHVREIAEHLLAYGKLGYRPTFFEQITAMALVAFAEAQVELAILETGLGGRLDATTAANAEIVAITPIDYDHQEYLGETLAEIASEKAAIIHFGSIVVVAEQKDEAMKIIKSVCSNYGVSPKLAYLVGTDCGSGWLKFDTKKAVYQINELGLLGRHQIENAKVAILLAETLQEYFPIITANIVEGLQNARHPGRLEYVGKFLFDGAHNVAGAKALREYLDEFVTQPVTLVFGAMRGKDVAEIAAILFPTADHIILTQPSNTRAMTPEEILKSTDREGWGRKPVSIADVIEFFKRPDDVGLTNGIILVTGSLYLVGEAKKILNN